TAATTTTTAAAAAHSNSNSSSSIDNSSTQHTATASLLLCFSASLHCTALPHRSSKGLLLQHATNEFHAHTRL
ncbi:hypothetical protein OC835_007803, partial [Tilletia horrida]